MPIKHYLSLQRIDIKQVKEFYDENKDYTGDDMRIKCIIKIYYKYKDDKYINKRYNAL